MPVRVAVRVAVARRLVHFFGTVPLVVADLAAEGAPRRVGIFLLHRDLLIVPAFVVVRRPAHAARLRARRPAEPRSRRGLNHPSVQLRPAAGSLLDVRRRRLSLDRAGRLLPNRSRGLVRRDTPRRGRVRGQLTLVKVAVLALEVLLEVDVVVVPPGQPNLSRLRAGTRGAARLEISDSLEFRSPLPEFSRQRIDVSLERHRAASLVVPNLAAAAATPRCLLIFVSALGLLRGFAPLLERGDVTEAQRGEAGELLREALEQLGLLPRRLQRQAGSGRPVVCSSQAGGRAREDSLVENLALPSAQGPAREHRCGCWRSHAGLGRARILVVARLPGLSRCTARHPNSSLDLCILGRCRAPPGRARPPVAPRSRAHRRTRASSPPDGGKKSPRSPERGRGEAGLRHSPLSVSALSSVRWRESSSAASSKDFCLFHFLPLEISRAAPVLRARADL